MTQNRVVFITTSPPCIGTPDHLRIVTTNFDTLFEESREREIRNTAGQCSGLRHCPLGGTSTASSMSTVPIDSHKDMVLTDADFGRAYLTEGWARTSVGPVQSMYSPLRRLRPQRHGP